MTETTLVRLQNDSLARILHDVVYKRILHFAQVYTPELPSEPVVMTWLNRLYLGDPLLYIYIDLADDYTIVGHLVIDVQEAFGFRVVFCHQAQGDKNNTAALDIGAELLDKIAQEVGAHCTVFQVAKHSKGLEKRYGYKAVRTYMLKYTNEQDEHDES